VGSCGLDGSVSEYGQGASCCGHGNEHSSSIKDEFFD
jgi:hypothetical protein